MPFVRFYGEDAVKQLYSQGVLTAEGCLVEPPQDEGSIDVDDNISWKQFWETIEPKEGFLIGKFTDLSKVPLIHDPFVHKRVSHRLLPDEYVFTVNQIKKERPENYSSIYIKGMLNVGIQLQHPEDKTVTRFGNGAPVSVTSAVLIHTERVLRLFGFAYTLFEITWECWYDEKTEQPVYALRMFSDYPTTLPTKEYLQWIEETCLKFEGLM
jgi:hypothetical protein